MADVYEPTRGGVRGGHDQFSWDQVKLDKDREHYLGHSLKVPVGRSQGGPDFMWYTKEKSRNADIAKREALLEEKKKVQEVEAQAMATALGSNFSFLVKTPVAAQSSRYLMTPTPQPGQKMGPPLPSKTPITKEAEKPAPKSTHKYVHKKHTKTEDDRKKSHRDKEHRSHRRPDDSEQPRRSKHHRSRR